MEAKLYKLSAGFAKHNKMMIYFVAVSLRETQRAVYLYGHGTTETTKIGVCCCCGRTLTHPVSVELGIGPECGQHWHNWDLIGGYNKENIARLKGAMQEIVFDHWVPKSVIEQVLPTTDLVVVPDNHPMIQKVISESENVIPNDILKNEKLNPNLDHEKLNPMTNKYAEVIEGNAQFSNQQIKVSFPFDFDLIAKIKAFPSRRYNPDGKFWTVPFTVQNAKQLWEMGFTLSQQLQSAINTSQVTSEMVKQDVKYREINIPGLKHKLFPFQSVGVSFLEKKEGRALIADEMGLGKTIQALAWLQLHPELRPALIVVPASLKLNWKREAEQWMTDPNVDVLYGTQPYITRGDIVVINYDLVNDWVVYLQSKRFKVLVMDEIHNIKNATAKRTKAIKQIAKGIPHVIGLSGTPIINRPIEAYNALTIINSSAVPNFKVYTQRYCAARHNGFGWDFSGASNTDELHRLLVNSFMIRRKKSEVLTDLPEKLKSFVPIELQNREEYERAERDFINYIRVTKGDVSAARAANAETLTAIEIMKQIAVKGKLQSVIDWIEGYLEEDGKLVVFAVHKFVIDALMDAFKGKAVKIDGSVSIADRDQAVYSFQNDLNVKLFVGNIQAAGVGLTLTAASNVAFVELPWTPGALNQAEDRCHRIGQKDSVTIHFLLAVGTIEEKIARLLDKKKMVLDAVLDGEQTAQDSLLSELMKEYL